MSDRKRAGVGGESDEVKTRKDASREADGGKAEAPASEAPAAEAAKVEPVLGGPRGLVAKRRGLRLAGVALVSLVGPVLAIALGLYLYLAGGRYISTDNAYVKSDKIEVSADVTGRVQAVHVAANELVTPGRLLFRIDAEPFEIAVARAEAQLLAARQAGESLKYLYRQKLAAVDQAKVDRSFFERQFDRQQRLKRKAIASLSTFDAADKNLRLANARLLVLKQDLAQVRAKLGGDVDTPVDQLPGVLTAAAALKQAKLDLKRTEVRAPLDGIITNFDLQKGEYVEAGKVIFSIVGTRDIWVQANFRETELTHMRVGQVAKVRVDAYPGDERMAVIASIDPATGAEFALLPPQNATGNWVKVVQRLPVRFKLEDGLRDPPLRTGMSVVVEVDTRHQRTLDGLLSSLLAWVGG